VIKNFDAECALGLQIQDDISKRFGRHQLDVSAGSQISVSRLLFSG